MKKLKFTSAGLLFLILSALLSNLCGCRDGLTGYSNDWLHPEEISTVYVEMFDSKSFKRGLEYDLTDAIAKRIEAQTPYKVVSDRDRADSLISGYIYDITTGVLGTERETGRPLEKEFQIRAAVKWKNLKTGRLLIAGETVAGFASYSEWMDQGEGYAAALASNRLAEQIVELMEKNW